MTAALGFKTEAGGSKVEDEDMDDTEDVPSSVELGGRSPYKSIVCLFDDLLRSDE